MSTDEQDLILGRLTRQTDEARRNLAALQSKLMESGRDLMQIGMSVKNFSVNEQAINAAETAIHGIPDKSELLSALAEWRAARERSRELNSQLAAFHS